MAGAGPGSETGEVLQKHGERWSRGGNPQRKKAKELLWHYSGARLDQD